MNYLLKTLRAFLVYLGFIRELDPLPPLELAPGQELIAALLRSGHWNGKTALNLKLDGAAEKGFINVRCANDSARAEVIADPKTLQIAPNSLDALDTGALFTQFDLPNALGQLALWQSWLKPSASLSFHAPNAAEWAKILCSESAWPEKLRSVDQLTRWGRNNLWFPERFSRTLAALGFNTPSFIPALDRVTGLHTNLQISASKLEALSEDQALRSADKLLSECASTVAERDQGLATFQKLLHTPAPAAYSQNSAVSMPISQPIEPVASTQPLISIAIICRPNSQLFDLHSTLESLRAQSVADFEIVIALHPEWQIAGQLDTSLGGRTLRILETLPADEQSAVVAAAQSAAGEYFLPIHAGDKLGRRALEIWTGLLNSHASSNLAYSHIQNSGQDCALLYQPDFVPGQEAQLPFACMCRRSLLEARDLSKSYRHWSEAASGEVAALLAPYPFYHRHT